MRSAAACIVWLLAGCNTAPICKPTFIIEWWEPPYLVPASDRARDIKSVTLMHCKG